MAAVTQALPPVHSEYRPTQRGLMARAAVVTLIVGVVALLPSRVDVVWADRISLAIIYAIIGLSINVLTGYAGQISLGHQAFVGIGAFVSAYVAGGEAGFGAPATGLGWGFAAALPSAAAAGALMALLLGLVALRIRGLYLALITLSFGLVSETTIFNIRSFTGGGAGAPAPRPSVFQSNQAYAYLCLLVLALFLFVDWRLAKSKAGRAIVALRNNERVAASMGVNVTSYKLLAFVVSGLMAGAAGSLFAHWTQFVQSQSFNLPTALTWVLMAVVGGLGSRAGVVIGSAFFAVFPTILPTESVNLPLIGAQSPQLLTPVIGALLLILTLTMYPGGIGQQLLPLRRWLAGGPMFEHHPKAKKPARAKRTRSKPAKRHEAAPPARPDGQAPAEGVLDDLQAPVPQGSPEAPAGDGQPVPHEETGRHVAAEREGG